MRRLTLPRWTMLAAGIVLCAAGGIQTYYPQAMILYIPGIALILTACYSRRTP